jgi:hypothetical protein
VEIDPLELEIRSEEDLPVSAEERALLDERLADCEANPDDQCPWPEVKARLELGSGEEFWRLIRERRRQQTISRAELERRLDARKTSP